MERRAFGEICINILLSNEYSKAKINFPKESFSQFLYSRRMFLCYRSKWNSALLNNQQFNRSENAKYSMFHESKISWAHKILRASKMSQIYTKLSLFASVFRQNVRVVFLLFSVPVWFVLLSEFIAYRHRRCLNR